MPHTHFPLPLIILSQECCITISENAVVCFSPRLFRNPEFQSWSHPWNQISKQIIIMKQKKPGLYNCIIFPILNFTNHLIIHNMIYFLNITLLLLGINSVYHQSWCMLILLLFGWSSVWLLLLYNNLMRVWILLTKQYFLDNVFFSVYCQLY